MTIWTGSVPTIAAGETSTYPAKVDTYRDVLKALTEPWTSYAPTWGSSGTAPAIGDGSIVAAYMQAGKYVGYRILLTVGTTTTWGTGVLSLTLPVAPLGSVGTWAWKGVAVDTGTAQYEWNLQWSGSGTACQMLYPNTGANALAAVSGTAPFTPGSTDTLSIQGFYEAA